MSDNNSKQNSKEPLDSNSQIQTASIDWRNNLPFSPKFDDIYFSSDHDKILAEIDHVFLKPNRLQERLTALIRGANGNSQDSFKDFTVGELGFGTGFNFFSLLNLFHELISSQRLEDHYRTEETHRRTPTLHYIGFEKHPLTCSDRNRLYPQQQKLFPQIASAIEQLNTDGPPPIEGIHRVAFPKFSTQLTLIYGDANRTISSLVPKFGSVDAWFLDGFAPSKNPSMWSAQLFEGLATLSSAGTTCSTFTAAKQVKENLARVGFEVTKIPGFGRKRDMLTATLSATTASAHQIRIPDRRDEQATAVIDNDLNQTIDPGSLKARHKPWFLHKRSSVAQNDITIIGGGLSGSACAYSLAKRGANIHLIERHPQLAQEASGNPMAALFAKFSPFNTAQNRFYQSSYIDALRHLKELKEHRSEGLWHPTGMLQLAYSPDEKARQQKLIESQRLPASIVQLATSSDIESISGFSSESTGLWLPSGGWADPQLMCHVRTQHPLIRLTFNREALKLKRDKLNHCWQILSQSGELIAQSSIVILASANDTVNFEQTQHLPLKTIRGQITQLKATTQSQKLSALICYNGYVGPVINGYHVIGATFQPKSSDLSERPEDHIDNLEKLLQAFPSLASSLNIEKPITIKPDLRLKSRTALRCQTPDYLPVVGPVPDQSYFQSEFRLLSKGNAFTLYDKGSYLPDLYVSVGHGSRGLATSHYSAELIASYITKEPPNMDSEMIEAVHPSRFILREIKRSS